METASVLLAAIQLSAAIVHQPYSAGPLAPAAISGCSVGLASHRFVEGEMPGGLALSRAGYLTGKPTQAGYYRFVIELDNGCSLLRLPMQISVLSAPILAVHTSELELTANRKTAILRVSSNWTDLAYTVETEASWLRLRPLFGRTPRPGQALEADLVEVEANLAEAGPDAAKALIRVSCWRCGNGTEVTVVLR